MDQELLDILACPKCKGDLRYTGDEFICDDCRLAYPIRDEIPIMLIDEARDLDAEDEQADTEEQADTAAGADDECDAEDSDQ